jgi:thiamine biosynthesis lipoprotein
VTDTLDLPVDERSAQWPVWSTTARVAVTDPAALAAARDIIERALAAVDLAASRFRADSEVRLLAASGGRPVEVSPLLADLVRAALEAASSTDGDVDPTLGADLAALGYDRDIGLVRAAADRPVTVRATRRPSWQDVILDGTLVRVPAGVVLDLGATAKAVTSDRCAALAARRTGAGVLVSLGGDIATAGPQPDNGPWQVLVQDREADPAVTVSLPAGAALATSSTASRTWRSGQLDLHHVLDPRTGMPVPVVWSSVTVAAWSCLQANALSTAALVRGEPAVPWLRELGAPARLVRPDGATVVVGAWPAEVPS